MQVATSFTTLPAHSASRPEKKVTQPCGTPKPPWAGVTDARNRSLPLASIDAVADSVTRSRATVTDTCATAPLPPELVV